MLNPSTTSPFQWVPEEKWSKEPGQVIVLEMNPELILPAVSVQLAWGESRGIIRGEKEVDGTLIVDHIREVIRDDRPVDAGRRISGADEMRSNVWTIERHKQEFVRLHPGANIVGWVGNGNLLSNPHFVGFAEGRLVHLASEGPLRASRRYSSLVVKKAGNKDRVVIDRVSYEQGPEGLIIRSHDGRDITHEVEYATFGQQIIRDGRPVNAAELQAMVIEGQFYDLRHVFLFGRIPVGDKQWLDAGLSALWDDKASLNVDAIKAAMIGEPVCVDVRRLDPETIREAMSAKGYVEVSKPIQPGHYSLHDGEMQVILLEGIYPHNMIGVRDDGIVISVVLRGLSNRVGVTIRGAAEIMHSLGARDALIVDNGGDVMMSLAGKTVLGSAEGERNRLRSVLFFCSASTTREFQPQDIRQTEYPKQFKPEYSRG